MKCSECDKEMTKDETFFLEHTCSACEMKSAFEPDTPIIVCLCGSTKFKQAFVNANKNETLKGKIVLSVGLFGHDEGLDMDSQTKFDLDQLHLRKIDLADEVLILNVNGYIGKSTKKEIEYSKSVNKPITYLEGIKCTTQKT